MDAWNGNSTIEPIKYEKFPEDSTTIAQKDQDNLLHYLKNRLDTSLPARSRRIRRMARIDKMISTWQILSPEDSARKNREESTGAPQGIAANLPIVDTHVDDLTSFFSEIFAPASGLFFSNQGETEKVKGVTALTKRLSADMKADGYYSSITSAMRSLLKYNMGGFTLKYSKPDNNQAGSKGVGGNRVKPVDLYNLLFDHSVRDLNKLREEGEWFATVEQVNRLTIYRMIEKNTITLNAESIIKKANESNSGTNDAKYYKYAPGAAGISESGEDSISTFESQAKGRTMSETDWASYGAGLSPDSVTQIHGHELTHMYIWLNPKQLELDTDPKAARDRLSLYYILIVDGEFIGHIEEIKNAIELPIYAVYFKFDEMLDSTRSMAEHLRPFQRHVSFYTNVTIAASRGNTYHTRIYDPSAMEKPPGQGETAGWLATKIPGRDVRSIVADVTQQADTSQNWAAIEGLTGLMQRLFPAQNLPAQIAGLDRAVQSQVAAVMQGATRRLHMQVRYLDAEWMNPFRVACYRNYADNDDASEFGALSEADVAELLNSGLGQLNREVAQAALERLLFTLIQNPESSAQFDMPELFTIWSLMLNTGTDLGQLVKGGAAGQQGAQPVPETGAEQPNPEAQAAMAAIAGGQSGG